MKIRKYENKVMLSAKDKKKMDRFLKKIMKFMKKQNFSNHVSLCFIRGTDGKEDWVNGLAKDTASDDYNYDVCIWG